MIRRQLAVFAAVGLLLTGCGAFRGGDEGKKEGAVTIGVTADSCPLAIDKKKGCIYLGVISDLTSGPFAALAVPLTNAQKAFWKRVNQAGGIGGKYEVDVQAHVRDNKYNAEVHNQVYQEIKGKVLGLAQTLGTPTTEAILADLKANNVVAAPASWSSAWEFEDVIVESGSNYCMESMNSVDYAVETYKPKSVMAVHLPNDYGLDAAAGAKFAAEANKLKFTAVQTQPGPTNQGGAISAIVKQKPDVVILTTSPTDAAALVGGAFAGKYTGRFIGTGPTWNPALMKSAAFPAFQKLYEQSAQGHAWGGTSAGHQAMRTALGNVTPNDGYVSGWTWSYPIKAALEKMVQSGDISRKGLLAAVKSLTSVDYEGMLPPEAGNYVGDPNATVFRSTVINKIDQTAPTGVALHRDFFVGPTAKAYNLDAPCLKKFTTG